MSGSGPRRHPLHPRRPHCLDRGAGQRGGGYRDPRLVPQHRDRQSQIFWLVLPDQRRERRFDRAARVAVADSARDGLDVPVAAGAQHFGSCRARLVRDHRRDRLGIGHRHQWHAALGDARLLDRDLLPRVAEEALVIDAELGDAGDGGRHHICRVEPPAQPDFDDAGIGGRARKRQESGGGGDLEEARAKDRRTG